MFRRATIVAPLLVAGCPASEPFHPSTPADATAAGSPLGPSYILVPLPNDDDSLLGRVLLDVPDSGRSLDEVSRPNECADKLTPKKPGPLASTFEDAQELAAGGKARAALGAFGFEGDAQTATHFYYKLDVSKRIAQTDTPDYVACCKEKGSCGYGFISALVYGDGQYATARENSAEGSVSIPLAGEAGGFVKASILHKRSVHGYVAALVTVTDQTKAKTISVLGDPAAAGIKLDEQNLPDQIKARFELEKVQLQVTGASSNEYAYVLSDGHGKITEDEFARRYATVTSSNELATVDRNRHAGWLQSGLVLGVLGLATSAVAGIVYVNSLPYGDMPSGIALAAGGGLVLFGGVSLIVYGGLGGHDGGTGDHAISKLDADLYVARYNRALLRKTVEETREKMQSLSGKNEQPALRVAPVVSPAFTGLLGQF
jgi:hypothetical protein